MWCDVWCVVVYVYVCVCAFVCVWCDMYVHHGGVYVVCVVFVVCVCVSCATAKDGRQEWGLHSLH